MMPWTYLSCTWNLYHNRDWHSHETSLACLRQYWKEGNVHSRATMRMTQKSDASDCSVGSLSGTETPFSFTGTCINAALLGTYSCTQQTPKHKTIKNVSVISACMHLTFLYQITEAMWNSDACQCHILLSVMAVLHVLKESVPGFRLQADGTAQLSLTPSQPADSQRVLQSHPCTPAL